MTLQVESGQKEMSEREGMVPEADPETKKPRKPKALGPTLPFLNFVFSQFILKSYFEE